MSTSRKSAAPPEDKVLACAGKIVSLIQGGQIVLHRRIGESSLAESLRVSRAVVRSALEHLEMVGLVSRVPRSGTFLRQISLKEFCDAMDIRAALETLSTRLAADRADERESKALLALALAVDALGRKATEGNPEVAAQLAQRDLEFHLEIAKLSGNQRLAHTLQQQRLIEFTFTQTRDFPIRQSARQKAAPTHQDIAKAIANHETAEAGDLMRRHILRTKESRLGDLVGELA